MTLAQAIRATVTCPVRGPLFALAFLCAPLVVGPALVAVLAIAANGGAHA